MKLDTIFLNAGLSAHQTTIYLALLGLGQATVLRISQTAKLPRTTCYQVLEQLQERGLVALFSKKKTKYFYAHDPRQFLRQQEHLVTQLTSVMPQLLASFHSQGGVPQVRYYQGVSGVEAILQEALDEADEILAYSSTVELKIMDEQMSKYIQERVRRKIPSKIIIRDTPTAKLYIKNAKVQLREIRALPMDYDYSNFVFSWKNKLALFTLQSEPCVFVIDSAEVAKFFRAVFYYMWASLPKGNP